MRLKQLLASLIAIVLLFGVGSVSLALPDKDKKAVKKTTVQSSQSAEMKARTSRLRKIMKESYKRAVKNRPAKATKKTKEKTADGKKPQH